MNELKIFEHEKFGKFRFVEIDGQIYMVGTEVATALGYKDPHKALKQHVEPEDWAKCPLPTKGGIQQTKIINESGFYCLVLASKLEGAKEFKRWVTSEVLPTIRKTGSYSMNPPKIEENTTIHTKKLTIKADNVTVENLNNCTSQKKITGNNHQLCERRVYMDENQKEFLSSQLEDYLQRKGVDTSKKSGFTCLICGSSDACNFVPRTNKTIWKCFSAKHSNYGSTGGDIFTYAEQLENTDFTGACDILASEYNLLRNSQKIKRFTPPQKTPEQIAEERKIEEDRKSYAEFERQEVEKILNVVKNNPSEYLNQRGISYETQKRYNIGYLSNFVHPKTLWNNRNNPHFRAYPTPRAIIPTSRGSILARATRLQDEGESGQYKALKVGSTQVFNADILKENIGYCFCFEGEIDALSGIECGCNSIGLGSTSMTDKLFQKYEINHNNVLIIAMDNDEGGKNSISKFEKLAKISKIPYIVADSNFLFNGAKDCNQALQENRTALKEHLEEYKNKALNFNKEQYFESLENPTATTEPVTIAEPVITADNIKSAEVLKYMFNLSSEIDILTYAQKIVDKARIFKVPVKEVQKLVSAYEKEAKSRLKATKTAELQAQYPDWVNVDYKGNVTINEPKYIKNIIDRMGIKTINNKMLSTNGEISINKISSIVQNDIEKYVISNIAVKTKNIVLAIKNKSYCEQLPKDTQQVHLNNGTYNLENKTFSTKKEWCLNRLAVKYNENAPKPTMWLNFLDSLLYKTDILTIQEMCGYFLIPDCRLQKMVFLIGDGEEGKSIVGNVMSALLGIDNINVDKLHELQDSRFKLANCENKLLFIDDDMKLGALKETGIIKSFVNGGYQQVEPKGIQSYNADLYTRALCFGNGTLTSLYDHSHGFFRRQLVIRVKPKDKNRENNLSLSDEIIQNELEGILLWALEGLHRLIDNNFKLTISPEVQKEYENAEKKNDNFLEFLESDIVEYNPNYNATTREIFDAYNRWIYLQGENPQVKDPKRITETLNKMSLKGDLPIKYDKHLRRNYSTSQLRGFRGIRLKVTNGNYPDENSYIYK